MHSTDGVQVPMPSAMTGDKLVNPERPPAGVVGLLAIVVMVEPAKASLNRKSAPPPAPVSTNLFPLFSVTVKSTEVPACVSVTVPNTVPTAGQPVEIWHDVKLKMSADACGDRPSAEKAEPPPLWLPVLYVVLSCDSPRLEFSLFRWM